MRKLCFGWPALRHTRESPSDYLSAIIPRQVNWKLSEILTNTLYSLTTLEQVALTVMFHLKRVSLTELVSHLECQSESLSEFAWIRRLHCWGSFRISFLWKVGKVSNGLVVLFYTCNGIAAVLSNCWGNVYFFVLLASSKRLFR